MRGLNRREKNSFKDFGWVISSWTQTPPKKRMITGTVPYRNGSYDFSDLGGHIAWDDRSFVVTFQKLISPHSAMAEETNRLLEWLCAGNREETWDDWDPHWYTLASCTSYTVTTNLYIQTVAATFSANPFRYSRRLYREAIAVGEKSVIVIEGQPVIPTVKASGAVTVDGGNLSASIPADTEMQLPWPLETGGNYLEVAGDEGSELVVTWREERL